MPTPDHLAFANVFSDIDNSSLTSFGFKSLFIWFIPYIINQTSQVRCSALRGETNITLPRVNSLCGCAMRNYADALKRLLI